MGLKQKAGEKGVAAGLVTRSQAVRKLQLSLPQFRRLCILKGVFPRMARYKSQSHRTHYLLKDIQYMAHDPVLKTFREQHVFQRKIKKLVARDEPAAAQSLMIQRPVYRLDHLVRERYPTFPDALHALDDAMTLLSVFSSHQTTKDVPRDRVENCERLVREWEAFVAHSKSLRKAFISLRGIYFEAEIAGQKITWMVPHPFQLRTAKVDYTIMASFLDFYQTLAAFVNYKLYRDTGLTYPPKINSRLLEAGQFLRAVTIYDTKAHHSSDVKQKSTTTPAATKTKETEVQQKSQSAIKTLPAVLAKISSTPEPTEANKQDEEEDEEAVAAAAAAPMVVDAEAAEPAKRRLVFEKCKFWLGREVQHRVLELIILSAGGQVSWEREGAAFEETDQTITHQIMDREKASENTIVGREYLQPQWVFDSLNEGMLLPTDEYKLGKTLPPHLSPFVNDEEAGYIPERRERLEKLRLWMDSHKSEDDTEDGAAAALFGELPEDKEREEEEKAKDDKEVEEALAQDEEVFQEELEAEKKGKPYDANEAKKEAKKRIALTKLKSEEGKRAEARQEKQRAVNMLTSKKKKQYERLVRKEEDKKKGVKKLHARRNAAAAPKPETK